MSKADTQWKKANISYLNYLAYLKGKKNKFELTLIDLLYIRNFKGGNASINEEECSVNERLKKYSGCLVTIDRKLDGKELKDLTEEELVWLVDEAYSFLRLTLASDTRIDGFGSSHASALLHCFFPNLIPVLDRRVLNGVGIKAKTNSQHQVINIEEYYPDLIANYYDCLKNNPSKSLRDYDRECFVKPIKNGNNDNG